jgi:hypothetical protein
MKHLISIGINNTEGLLPLAAAAKGAEEIAIWGNKQGYNVTLITDKTGKISQQQIFSAIHTIIQQQTCEQLLIYFSGHGLLKSPSQEIWLLSDAKINPNESINITASIDNARNSGIPYILFISDACRVLPTEIQFTGNGAVIFPILNNANNDTAIDILYASRPGNPAYEFSSQENAKSYGLFTNSLLEVINGMHPHIMQNDQGEVLKSFYDVPLLQQDISYKSLTKGKWQINTITSEALIKNLVADKAGEINIMLQQHPTIIIQYQQQKPSIAAFEDLTAKQSLLNNSKIPNPIADNTNEVFTQLQESILQENHVLNQDDITASLAYRHLSMANNQSTLLTNTQLIYESKGRQSFETQTGFTIIGTNIQTLLIKGNFDIIDDEGNTHIRIHPGFELSTALLVLKNGAIIPLGILRGYIGTLVFANQQLLTVNYTPSENSDIYPEYHQYATKTAYLRSLMASAASEGYADAAIFRYKAYLKDNGIPTNTEATSIQSAFWDPTICLYLSYAYKQNGNFKDIQQLYHQLSGNKQTILFDIAMLANQLNNDGTETAGFCPLLALGWAYKSQYQSYIDPLVLQAAAYMQPSFWTTFHNKGAHLIKTYFNQL